MAHEDAVNEFLQAEEPILVEVKRRSNSIPSSIPINSHAISNGGGGGGDGDGGAKTTVINDALPPTKLSSGKSSVFESSPLSEQPQQKLCDQQRHKSISTTSIAVQTELMLCDFDSDYICHGSSGSGGSAGNRGSGSVGGGGCSNDSPTRIAEHHHSHINHSSQINSMNNNNNNNNSSNINHNSSNGNGHHHPFNHCAMLNECMVPPEIDIEVSPF